MSSSALSVFQSGFGGASTATMGIMSILSSSGSAITFPKATKWVVFGGAIALVSFLLLTPFVLEPETGKAVAGVIPVDRLGAKGMFLGMMTAFCQVKSTEESSRET